MNARRLILASFCIVLSALAFLSAQAQAELVHPFVSSFGSFGHPGAIAIDQSSGDVYVYQENQIGGSIEKFNAAGEKTNFSALGTNAIGVGSNSARKNEIAVSSSGSTAGDIYVANGSSVTIYGEDGVKLGELMEAPVSGAPWGEPCGIAVDPAGNVYVALYPESVDKYTPAGNPVSNADYKASMVGLDEVCDIAADSEGNVYADTYPEGPVTKYEASQFLVSPLPASGTVIDPSGSSVALDPTNNNLYVDDETAVAQYSSSGVLLGTFSESGSGALRFSHGIAVKEAQAGKSTLPISAAKLGIIASMSSGRQW